MLDEGKRQRRMVNTIRKWNAFQSDPYEIQRVGNFARNLFAKPDFDNVRAMFLAVMQFQILYHVVGGILHSEMYMVRKFRRSSTVIAL